MTNGMNQNLKNSTIRAMNTRGPRTPLVLLAAAMVGGGAWYVKRQKDAQDRRKNWDEFATKYNVKPSVQTPVVDSTKKVE